jgi:hypothetical protein
VLPGVALSLIKCTNLSCGSQHEIEKNNLVATVNNFDNERNQVSSIDLAFHNVYIDCSGVTSAFGVQFLSLIFTCLVSSVGHNGEAAEG